MQIPALPGGMCVAPATSSGKPAEAAAPRGASIPLPAREAQRNTQLPKKSKKKPQKQTNNKQFTPLFSAQTRFMGLDVASLGGFPLPGRPRTCSCHKAARELRELLPAGILQDHEQDQTPFFPGVTGLVGLCDLPVRTPSEAGSRRMGILLLVSAATQTHPQLALKPEYRLGKAVFSAGTSHCQHCKKKKLTAEVDGDKELPKPRGMRRTSFPLLFHAISVPRKKAFHWIF